jgi:putative transposase
LRGRVRELIQAMIESELETVLSRPRYARRPTADSEDDGAGGVTGHRHGHRSRSLLGTFGRVEIAVPRARLDTAQGKTTEWKSKALRAYQRRTQQALAALWGDVPTQRCTVHKHRNLLAHAPQRCTRRSRPTTTT